MNFIIQIVHVLDIINENPSPKRNYIQFPSRDGAGVLCLYVVQFLIDGASIGNVLDSYLTS
jgi:hypothetical protein